MVKANMLTSKFVPYTPTTPSVIRIKGIKLVS
jgi:hypothetical protein